jgi:hypothetical protein
LSRQSLQTLLKSTGSIWVKQHEYAKANSKNN